MRTSLTIIAALCFGAMSFARADSSTAAVQQKLKDQGFYYGEITGTNDADTTAAIRRYQIRNGLKITGQLDAETQKSLGVKGSPPSKASTPPAPVGGPSAAPPAKPAPEPGVSDLRQSEPAAPQTPPMPETPPRSQPGAPQPGYAPGPQTSYPAPNGLFAGTPFQTAPADVQRRVVIAAQTLLVRQGYYRGASDGEYGPGTLSAVRAYQARFRMAPTGRLDTPTLAALGLLPGQRAPGMDVPRQRIYRPPIVAPPPVYIPR